MEMNETDDDHYHTPKPAKPCPPITPPVPAVRRKKVAASAEENAQKSSPLSESSASVQPSAVQVPVPALAVTSHAVQSALESQVQPAAVSEDNFGSCLQSARDCINRRHDDELKALECFRVFMHKRAKADAEYAVILGRINSQTARDAGSIATGSKIVQAWNGVIEAMDTIQKRIQHVSKQVEDIILRATDQLIKEKRGLKRAYDISRSQLDAEYSDSCSQVHSLKKEYRHLLQVTEGAKRKLEKCIQKSNVKQAESDKLYAKFVSSAEKLHQCHNEYTLAILNANTHLDHYHKSMLPFCLNTLQERMEHLVSQWKGNMEEYVHTLDMSEVYQESFGKLAAVLKKLNPKDEYIGLMKDNKSNEDTDEEKCLFDASLLQDYCSPKVEATKMSINNLTYDNLKAELSKMEQRLGEYENERVEKEKRSIVLDNGNGPDSEEPKAVIRANLQADLKQLDFKIDREKVKITRIKEDLNEMGKAPPIFDSLGEVVGSTRNLLPSTEINTNGNVNKESKLEPSLTNLGESGEEKDEDSECYETFQTEDAHLEDEGWFHANMNRKEAEEKCKNPGDYLIRYSSKQNRYVLTVSWAGQGKHFVIQEIRDEKNQTKYGLEFKSFPSIPELLQFHVATQTAVSRSTGAVLKQPVLRNSDKWALYNDDISVGKRLGKGAFGEVFDAEFKGQKVAVKMCHSTDIPDREKFLQEAEDLEAVRPSQHCEADWCFLGYGAGADSDGADAWRVAAGLSQEEGSSDVQREAATYEHRCLLCDVWSYGILLWEVFSGGAIPYAGMSNTDAKDHIDGGYHMPLPAGCPKEVYSVMQQCWMHEPEDRPNFTQVLGMLKALKGTVI
eukprot:Em0010g773a